MNTLSEYKYLLLAIVLLSIIVVTEGLVFGIQILRSLALANIALGAIAGAWAASKE